MSFSVDPAHDDERELARYAERWSANETRWSLLRTDPRGLARVARNFRITADACSFAEWERTAAAGGPLEVARALTQTTERCEPVESGQLVHSTVFVLADAESRVRGVYASEDNSALDRLSHDVARLLEP